MEFSLEKGFDLWTFSSENNHKSAFLYYNTKNDKMQALQIFFFENYLNLCRIYIIEEVIME